MLSYWEYPQLSQVLSSGYYVKRIQNPNLFQPKCFELDHYSETQSPTYRVSMYWIRTDVGLGAR